MQFRVNGTETAGTAWTRWSAPRGRSEPWFLSDLFDVFHLLILAAGEVRQNRTDAAIKGRLVNTEAQSRAKIFHQFRRITFPFAGPDGVILET